MTELDPVPVPAAAALEPIALRTERQPLAPRWDVIVSPEGIAWQRKGSEAGHWAPWPLVGGVANGVGTKTPTTTILALDGSAFGSIDGLLQFEGQSTSLAHVVVLFRPDLFVEVEGYPWTGGCIRRDVETQENGATPERR